VLPLLVLVLVLPLLVLVLLHHLPLVTCKAAFPPLRLQQLRLLPLVLLHISHEP
jgi:hypothetical protein